MKYHFTTIHRKLFEVIPGCNGFSKNMETNVSFIAIMVTCSVDNLQIVRVSLSGDGNASLVTSLS